MNYIKLFEEFGHDVSDQIKKSKESETLYIFDLDNTLVKSPSFEELAIEYLNENKKISGLISRSLRVIGKSKSDLKIENGRIFVDDPNNDLDISRNWVRKGSRVYMITPDVFNFLDISLPTKLKKLSELYKSVENKAIVTGRSVDMEDKIKDTMKKLGLEFPNYGIHCYPQKKHEFERVGQWKGNKIVELISENGFNSAKFYEDNSKWVKTARKIVSEKLPNIDFQGIKV